MFFANFTLKTEDEKLISEKDFIGKYTILSLFRELDLPNFIHYAAELSNFVEWFELKNARVAVVLSCLAEKLKQIKTTCKLRIELLCDENGSLMRSVDNLKDKKISPATIILDRWGRVRKMFDEICLDSLKEEFEQIITDDNTLNPLIQLRRAKRSFSQEKVSRDALKTIISAAHLAPSCANKQPWRFIVIESRDFLEKIHKALSGGNYWMKNAPALIVVYSKKDLDCELSDGRDYFLFDLGQAVALLQIQATQMGLIAHPVAGFDPVLVKQVLSIPEEYTVITILAIGYPSGNISSLSEKHQAIEFSSREREKLDNVAKFI